MIKVFTVVVMDNRHTFFIVIKNTWVGILSTNIWIVQESVNNKPRQSQNIRITLQSYDFTIHSLEKREREKKSFYF